MSGYSHRINLPQKISPQISTFYLEMLAMAIGKISYNKGAQRKEIWRYFMDNLMDIEGVNYQTFLLAITQLCEEGKLERNENGYLWIHNDVYQELYKNSKKGKLSVTSKSGKETAAGGTQSIGRKSLGKISSHRDKNSNCLSSAYRTYASSQVGSGSGNHCNNYSRAHMGNNSRKQSQYPQSQNKIYERDPSRPNSNGKSLDPHGTIHSSQRQHQPSMDQ